ncbi:MAG: hypothetical protein WC236_01900 [Gallionellaceae bacterium]|jgi:uncharacterized protein (DUF3084 family)
MGKIITLLLIILFAVASAGGYLYLSDKISAGDKQIAAGQIQLDKGQLALDEGKLKLEAGKQELLEGKQEYAQAEDNFFLVLADKLLQGGKGFEDAREQIADGESQIAAGENKVSDGEKRIDAGELKLERGLKQIQLAKNISLGLAISAVFFTILAAVLGFSWRRTLKNIFKH